jgi:subtilisin family serine protease
MTSEYKVLSVGGWNMFRKSAFSICVVGIALMIVFPSGLSTYTPDDPHWDHATEDQWGPEAIHVDDAWDLSNHLGRFPAGDGDGFSNPGKRDIVVAVIDTGADMDHPDLEDNIWDAACWDYSDDTTDVNTNDNHGTLICGIIAGITDNNVGIAGIAQVRLMVIKITDDNGNPPPIGTRDITWARAIDRARTTGADIISISWKFWEIPGSGFYDLTRAALDRAINDNIIIVTSSGNWDHGGWDAYDWRTITDGSIYEGDNWVYTDDNGDGFFTWEVERHWVNIDVPPGGSINRYIRLHLYDDWDNDYVNDINECNQVKSIFEEGTPREDIIYVGSSDSNNLRAEYSFWGDNLDVLAPGGGDDLVYSTELDGTYGFTAGTSFAAPHVAGVAALIMSYRPDLTSEEVRHIIEQSCDDIVDPSGHAGENPDEGWDAATGWGLVNAKKALRLANEWKTSWAPSHQYSSVYNADSNSPYNTMNADLDPRGFTHIVFVDDRAGPAGFNQIYYKRVSPAGTVDINDMMISANTRDCDYPDIFVTKGSYINIVWREWDAVTSKLHLMYVCYEADMAQISIARQSIRSLTDALSYQTPRVVVDGPDAYIFYDERSGANDIDINYLVMDINGALTGPFAFTDDDEVEGLGPLGLDVDISFRNGDTRIHVVWQESTGFGAQRDIMYWSLKLVHAVPPQKVPLNNPVVIANSLSEERYPSIDAEYASGFAHIVFESDDTIHYSVVDPEGGFIGIVEVGEDDPIEGEAQVGLDTDHDDIYWRGVNGKMFPTISYSMNNVVTIVWREWEDDYEWANPGMTSEQGEPLLQDGIDNDGDGLVDEKGWFSVYYCQYFIEREHFHDNAPPDYGYLVSPMTPWREEILVHNINDYTSYKDSNDRIVVISTDLRKQKSQNLDQDSHIRVLYQEQVNIATSNLNMITTREYWEPSEFVDAAWDGEDKDPDIDVDDANAWHIVYTSQVPHLHNSWEIYYANEYHRGLPVAEMQITNPNQNADSLNPRIVTLTFFVGEVLNVHAYIFWIDKSQNPQGELYFVIVDALTYTFIGPAPGNAPARVPFVNNPPPRAEAGHEVAFDEERGVIHVIFCVKNMEGNPDRIHHGSLDLGGNTVHTDSHVSTNDGNQYNNPAIDVGPDGRPYVVYTRVDQAAPNPSNIFYDVLLEAPAGGNIVMQLNNPRQVDTHVNADRADIKIDRATPRNCDVAPNNPNLFVHIVWVEGSDLFPGWKVKYAKFHPLDIERDPEILNTYPYVYTAFSGSTKKPDPELAITSQGFIALIFTANTMGYKPNHFQKDYSRVFYMLLDNNGVSRTTSTLISENRMNENTVHAASAIDGDDRLFCAWDIRDPTTNAYSNMIDFRYHDWRAEDL